MSLATCRNNQPWSTDLFYASDEFCHLYFVSRAKTLHCQNIKFNSNVSATIRGEEVSEWKKIKGLQLDGVAEVVTKQDREWVVELYLDKFQELRRLHDASVILNSFIKSDFYKISPNWIRSIDNSKGFGHKDEMIF